MCPWSQLAGKKCSVRRQRLLRNVKWPRLEWSSLFQQHKHRSGVVANDTARHFYTAKSGTTETLADMFRLPCSSCSEASHCLASHYSIVVDPVLTANPLQVIECCSTLCIKLVTEPNTPFSWVLQCRHDVQAGRFAKLGCPLTVVCTTRSLVVTAASKMVCHMECYSCDRSSTHKSKVSQHTCVSCHETTQNSCL